MNSVKFVLDGLKGMRIRYFSSLAIVIINSYLTLLPTLIIGMIVDDVLYGGHKELLWRYVILLIGVSLLFSGIRFITRYNCAKSAQCAAVNLRYKLYEKLQTLDADFFMHSASGELISNLSSDVTTVNGFLSDHCYLFVRDISSFIMTFVMLITRNFILTLILLAFLPILVLLSIMLIHTTRMLHRRLREKFSEMNDYVNENLGAYRVVKAFAREDYENERMEKISAEYRDMSIDNTRIRLNRSTPLHLIAEFMSIFALCISGIFIIRYNMMSVGDLTIFTSLVFTLVSSVRNITTLLSEFQRVRVSADKMYALYTTDPDIDNSPIVDIKKGAIKKIEFKDVSLVLGGNRILDHINLTVHRGETIAIMGPTGAGKTILISMLLRLYDPTEGQILINGEDIRNMDINKLRKMIAISTQDVFLFSDTIDSNIAYSDPELPFEKVKEFAECAQASDFIEKLSEGYDTIIGERGVGLSGGQRQRIALARAVAKDASLIILDDTTSAVDMETESLILKELAKIRDKTKIIVAQRISSVVDADRIYIIQNGRITEQGTHAELVKLGGYYTSIYKISREGEQEVLEYAEK